jgi:hypothetical protein
MTDIQVFPCTKPNCNQLFDSLQRLNYHTLRVHQICSLCTSNNINIIDIDQHIKDLKHRECNKGNCNALYEAVKHNTHNKLYHHDSVAITKRSDGSSCTKLRVGRLFNCEDGCSYTTDNPSNFQRHYKNCFVGNPPAALSINNSNAISTNNNNISNNTNTNYNNNNNNNNDNNDNNNHNNNNNNDNGNENNNHDNDNEHNNDNSRRRPRDELEGGNNSFDAGRGHSQRPRYIAEPDAADGQYYIPDHPINSSKLSRMADSPLSCHNDLKIIICLDCQETLYPTNQVYMFNHVKRHHCQYDCTLEDVRGFLHDNKVTDGQNGEIEAFTGCNEKLKLYGREVDTIPDYVEGVKVYYHSYKYALIVSFSFMKT